ncbi:MAG: hypothetical protein L3J01_06280 [Thiomicrorhabdus sp.]|nr:hypothetical protein [Thiomicrorhabdus sp.]
MSKDESADDQKSKPWFRRVFKWLLILTATFFVVIIAIISIVRVGDYVWFRSHVPLRFANANWTGNWKTQQYGLSGRLLVHLPDPLPENEDFQAEAIVYYPIYSIWKTGSFVKMEFTGNFSPESSTSTGLSKNDSPDYRAELKLKGKRGKMKFRATAGDQVVDYVAMMDESGERLIGSYISKSPHDIGYFFIQNY